MNMEDLVSASTLGYSITIAVLSVLTLLGVAVFLLFGGKLQTNLLVWIGIGICLLVVVATLGGIFMSSDRTIRYEPSTRTLFVFANRFTRSESETFKLSSSTKIRIKPVKYRAILHVVSIVDSVGVSGNDRDLILEKFQSRKDAEEFAQKIARKFSISLEN